MRPDWDRSVAHSEVDDMSRRATIEADRRRRSAEHLRDTQDELGDPTGHHVRSKLKLPRLKTGGFSAAGTSTLGQS
jgi:hypothetical protein